MNKGQIDNSFFVEKVRLRIDNLPDKEPLRVLDLYAGQGKIWDEVRKKTGMQIKVLGIEKKKINGKIYLQGDNNKFRMDYDQFDVIDLDAYGIPFDQMQRVFISSIREKTIFITFIPTYWGALPHGLLVALGYSRRMIKKIPTLFNRHAPVKLMRYLASHGVTQVKIYTSQDHRKNYLCVKINEPHN